MLEVNLSDDARIRGCLLGDAIGDPFGYKVEFKSLKSIRGFSWSPSDSFPRVPQDCGSNLHCGAYPWRVELCCPGIEVLLRGRGDRGARKIPPGISQEILRNFLGKRLCRVTGGAVFRFLPKKLLSGRASRQKQWQAVVDVLRRTDGYSRIPD